MYTRARERRVENKIEKSHFRCGRKITSAASGEDCRFISGRCSIQTQNSPLALFHFCSTVCWIFYAIHPLAPFMLKLNEIIRLVINFLNLSEIKKIVWNGGRDGEVTSAPPAFVGSREQFGSRMDRLDRGSDTIQFKAFSLYAHARWAAQECCYRELMTAEFDRQSQKRSW